VEKAKVEAIVPTRPDWLDLRREEALDPALPIVDPHHHLWDRGGTPYYVPEFLQDVAASGHNILSTVYLECHAHYYADGPEHLRPVGEIAFAADEGERGDAQPGGPRICAGIVGNADVRGERLQEVLDAMVAAGRGRFRGLRNIAAWHADPNIKGTVFPPPAGLLQDEAFRRGVKLLGANGLTFDTWALHSQLSELHDLAIACPEATVIMDHTGGAIGMGPYVGQRDLALGEWRAAIRHLAKAPNVVAKIGGFGMRLWGFGFYDRTMPPSSEELAAALKPYVETCIEAFGPDRCMFESNFPVDKGSFAYGILWNAFKRLASGYSPDERGALFRGTAERVYRI
jgi:L-fuconolactonase